MQITKINFTSTLHEKPAIGLQNLAFKISTAEILKRGNPKRL